MHEPPLVGTGEPGGLGPQGQLLDCRAGLCSGHSHRLTPGQGGEEVEVCAARWGSLTGWECWDTTQAQPPCQAQTPKQLVSCYSLLGLSQHPLLPLTLVAVAAQLEE